MKKILSCIIVVLFMIYLKDILVVNYIKLIKKEKR